MPQKPRRQSRRRPRPRRGAGSSEPHLAGQADLFKVSLTLRMDRQASVLLDANGRKVAALASMHLRSTRTGADMQMTIRTRSTRVSTLMLFALFLASLFAFAAEAQDSAPVDWSGTWESSWRDGGARLILEQDGAAVTGTYPLFDGRIEAVAQGRELRGRWIQAERSGTFLFVQSRDGRSFAGRFGSGEWWTGARAVGEIANIAVDQSSPQAVMGGFLASANEAADGNLEAFAVAVAVMRPAGDEAQDFIDRFRLAQLLFDVVDQTTFRLWDLPHEPDDGADDDGARVLLEQAGTGETVEIAFTRREGRWYLSPPPARRLVSIRDRMRAARVESLGAADEGPLSTPRETMRSFLLSFRHSPGGDHEATRSALDLRGRPEVTRAHDGQLLAGYLKRVIDRTGYVIWQEIPDDPNSRVPYIHFRHPYGTVAIAPVETQDGVIWQFTPETLRSIREVYAAMEDMPVAPGLRVLPDDDIRFAIRSTLRGLAPGALVPLGPLERWQWGALGGVIIGATGAAWLAGWGMSALGRRAGGLRTQERTLGVGIDGWSVRSLATGIVLLVAGWFLALPDRFTVILATSGTLLVVLGLFLLGWRGIGAAAERYRRTERVTGHNLILLSLASGVLRGAALIAAVLALAHALSLPITGVLAGFGIGGIAVALAAQPTLQNLLSGFTLYADRPISVGDFCRFGDKMGTVEHIGLRSTQLRTLDRTVISVPNSQFLDMQLENFARRDRFLFTTTLQLRYETTPDQMRYVLVALRKLLIAHPIVLPDPLRVRFAGLGAHSLDVEIFAYILAADMDSFTTVREDILLRIMETVEEAGAQFAFPSMVHYNADDEGVDSDRVARAEALVAEWRREGSLPFPDFEWQTKAELSGSLDYPPQGSVQKRSDPRD